MGAWGINLYDDDMALDIRDTIQDELKLGIPLNKILDQLKFNYDIEKYDNNDEEPVFWCVIADTLWNLGLLDNEVKSKALYWIDLGGDIQRWKFETPGLAYKRNLVFLKLKQKLISTQPPKKRISKKRLYVCPWNKGDVFAMRLNGELAKEKNLIDTYLLFQVADKYLHPIGLDKKLGHLCPIVRTKLTFSKKIPQLEDFNNNEIIKNDFPCKTTNWKNIYAILIYTTSTRTIPKNLMFLGNKSVVTPNDDYGIFYDQINIINNIYFTLWKRFEDDMIENYYGHNLKQFSIYHEEN